MSKTKPIAVIKQDGEWVGNNSLGEKVVASPKKEAAVEKAKDWASRHEHDGPVVIHTADGWLQGVWWPKDQRYLRVRPMNTDEKEEYSSIVKGFKRSDHREPFWVVEWKDSNRWRLLDIKTTKRKAVDHAREKQKTRFIREISVYNTDWYKSRSIKHDLVHEAK